MTTRKNYTAEFKRQAIELAQRPDIGPSRAARDLGISLSALSRWRKQAEQQGSHAFPGHGRTAMTPQEQEIKRLQKELEILRQEREILKKAAAFFAKESH
ncbi:transposase [Deinococcus cavernae]|uniref:Transposase n=1 Tax=Deinococcus cavernae TaxID=2320857 RepID=A0A418VHS1_9DEIO|nr:transposase [Deinococcus cavernae]RJF75703.1 transposase [Deinococcus cavernae]